MKTETLTRSALIVIIISVAAFAAAQEIHLPFDPPESVQHRYQEAEAKALAYQRAQALAGIGPKNWAPEPEPTSIDVLSYTLDLYLDTERRLLSGTVVVEVAAVEDGLEYVTLDADLGLRMLAVVLVEDGTFPGDSVAALPFEHKDDRLTITLPRPLAAGQSVSLLIPYGGNANRSGPLGSVGVIWGSYGFNTPAVYTFAEPFGARVWWPCNDRPDDKAIVDLAVTVREDLDVAANGLERERIDNGDGTATSSWSSAYPVATYLVVMHISEFDYSEETYDTMDGGTMPVALYAFPNIATQAKLDLEFTPEAIEVLAARFGEYPFVEEKYGNCTVNFGGGMEHQTMTTLAAGVVGNPWMEWLNVHELGHQWWGDWVTLDDWREVWLNEGFATYSEWVWAEYLGPSTLAQFKLDEDPSGFFLGSLYDNIFPFSSTVYSKGGWTLHMLRQVLGDEDFFAGMAEYRQSYGGGSATSEDLRHSMEAASDMDLEFFWNQWVYGENRPHYLYEWRAVAGPAVELTVQQVHSNAGYFKMPMEVRVTTSGGAEEHTVWLEAVAEQTMTIETNAQATGIELDPNNNMLAFIGPASGPALDLGPEAPGLIEMGVVRGGQSVTTTVPLRSVGGSDLVITGLFSQPGSPFTIDSPTSFPLTIPAGESVDAVVRFSPSGPGQHIWGLWAQSDDPSGPGFTVFVMEGTGGISEDPWLAAPPSATAGSAELGTSEDAFFSLSNLGVVDLLISSVTLEGGDFSFGSPIPSVVAPGAQIIVYVRFSPTTVGDQTAVMTFTSNDPQRPTHQVTFSGEGTSAPRLDVNPAPVNLGIVEGGDDTTTVMLSNTGTEDLVISALVVGSPFLIPDFVTLPMTIEAGAQFGLEMGLDAKAAGDHRSALQITSNDPAIPRVFVPVSGHVAAGPIEGWNFPAAATTTGLGGAQWRTEAFVVNPTDGSLAVDLAFRPFGVRGQATPDRTLELPPRSQRVVANLVAELGHEGTGAVTLDIDGRETVSVSRTFSDEAAGTYGQHIPSVADADALTGGSRYLLAGLAGIDGFHTNLGIQNVGDSTVTVDFEMFDAAGASLGMRRLTAAPGAYNQKVRAFQGLSDGAVRGGFAILSSASDGAAFNAFASVVDDASHDPTYVTPIGIDDPQPLDVVVPVVASNPGLNETVWRSQVAIVNTGSEEASVELTFISSAGPSTAEVTVAAGAALLISDVVADTIGATGSGVLLLASPSTGLYVTSRTYNDNPIGTFGQAIPAVASDELSSSGETVVLAGLSSADGFRTNFGVTSLADAPTTVTVQVYDNAGNDLGAVDVEVPARRFVQVDRLLHSELGYEGTAWATVSSEDSGARYVAHVSVVDGDTGDPAYIPAQARDVEVSAR